LLCSELPTTAAQNNLRVAWLQLREPLGKDQDESESYLIRTRLDLDFNPHSDHTLEVILFI
jgi:hypothetical protein